jgi:outer membrane receptor protein involved in Fe transport
VRQAAVYFNATIAADVRHTLTAGLRYSSVDVHLPASGMVPESGVMLDDLSADASWRFDVAESWQIVANVGRGFRAPNVFDLGTLGERPGNRFNIPSPGLGAEHVAQFDAGLRFLRSGLTAELVVYRLRYADRITSVLTGDVTSDGRDVIQSRNVSSAGIRGIEAFATAEFSSRLSAGLLLNYGHGKQSAEDGSSVPADRMPPLNGKLNLEVRLNELWSLDTSLQFADKQSRLSPRDVRDIRINPAGTSGWGIVNTRADWQPGNGWHLAAELVNLLDHRYRNHGSGIDATGRSVLLSASRRW